MTPEEVAIRFYKTEDLAIIFSKTEDVDIDFKRFNNLYPTQKKKRIVERCQKRIVEKIKPSKEASKTVAARLQKKLIERGKTPNLGPNFFAYGNL